MNDDLVFWDGTYCMVCQTNYGIPDDTEVENFLCRRCNEYAGRNALIRRIDLFEKQSAMSRHPASADVTPGTITYQSIEIDIPEEHWNEDEVHHVPCSHCNREEVEGMWLLQVDKGTYNEIIGGPLCESCYEELSADFYGESGV